MMKIVRWIIAIISTITLMGCTLNRTEEVLKTNEDKNISEVTEMSNNNINSENENDEIIQNIDSESEISLEASDYEIDTLYEYEKIYDLYTNDIEQVDWYSLCSLLQNKNLELKDVKYLNDIKYLRIYYSLNLDEKNSKYTFEYQKELQDTLVLFALFSDIETVVFLYTQEGYSAQVDYDINKTLINSNISDLDDFHIDLETFTKLNDVINGVTYNPDIMPYITYEHIISGD